MKIEFTVFKATSETRELVGKDGVKSSRNIAHISGFGADDVFDVTVYDPGFITPNKGQKIALELRKLECYGGVANCVCDGSKIDIIK